MYKCSTSALLPVGNCPLLRPYARPARDWWLTADEGTAVFTFDDLNKSGVRLLMVCRNAIFAYKCQPLFFTWNIACNTSVGQSGALMKRTTPWTASAFGEATNLWEAGNLGLSLWRWLRFCDCGSKDTSLPEERLHPHV